MTTWVRVDAGLPANRKSVELGELLGNPLAWAHLVRLWGWAIQNAKDGHIGGRNPARQVEAGAGWTGEPGRFTAAALEVGFLVEDGEGLLIHDWEEHNGKALRRAGRDAERARLWREERQAARDAEKDAELERLRADRRQREAQQNAEQTRSRTRTERIREREPNAERDETGRDGEASKEESLSHAGAREPSPTPSPTPQPAQDEGQAPTRRPEPPPENQTPPPGTPAPRPAQAAPKLATPEAPRFPESSERKVRELYLVVRARPGCGGLPDWFEDYPGVLKRNDWDEAAQRLPMAGERSWQAVMDTLAQRPYALAIASPSWLMDPKEGRPLRLLQGEYRDRAGGARPGTGPPGRGGPRPSPKNPKPEDFGPTPSVSDDF